MTNPDIQQAKEWAESRANGNYLLSEGTKEAVKVIQSLPDHIIDAEKLREVVSKYEGNTYISEIVQDFADLLPAPALPTLADMTPEERGRCLWMQVYLPRHLPGAILTDPGSYGIEPRVMYQDGATFTVKHEDVTPLPDLPKLEWPGDGVVDAEIVEDDEPTLPRPEDVPPGEPWIVEHDGYDWVGTRGSREETVCSWSLARLDGADYSVARDAEITLVSRLVPEVTP